MYIVQYMYMCVLGASHYCKYNSQFTKDAWRGGADEVLKMIGPLPGVDPMSERFSRRAPVMRGMRVGELKKVLCDDGICTRWCSWYCALGKGREGKETCLSWLVCLFMYVSTELCVYRVCVFSKGTWNVGLVYGIELLGSLLNE